MLAPKGERTSDIADDVVEAADLTTPAPLGRGGLTSMSAPLRVGGKSEGDLTTPAPLGLCGLTSMLPPPRVGSASGVSGDVADDVVSEGLLTAADPHGRGELTGMPAPLRELTLTELALRLEPSSDCL